MANVHLWLERDTSLKVKNAYILIGFLMLGDCSLLLMIMLTGSFFIMEKLTFISICTVTWSELMPLLTHFCLIVLMQVILSLVQFFEAMSICTFLAKFTMSSFWEILTHFSFIVYFEISDISNHFLPCAKIDLLSIFTPTAELWV